MKSPTNPVGATPMWGLRASRANHASASELFPEMRDSLLLWKDRPTICEIFCPRGLRGVHLGKGDLVFAHDAVAAAVLGPVEAGIGALDQRRRRVARAKPRHPGGDRDGAEDVARRAFHQLAALDVGADLVGEPRRV